ncbi:hypothetical protein Rsub_10061 [Raphidocelis subcapitata]|uniref:DUF7906 domain-containing protein n=1 Tax=Raphidocelis subcapitata TaxID=307507 RepID=A0A2V0PH03_9CHLO|nr:hypothetical protein Rsub_10061 [Raphidocelis subcapitata]|eukprot:GBF97200.1 hypothetical protein Rsub_10061 [Raphidocelis subcapitata]
MAERRRHPARALLLAALLAAGCSCAVGIPSAIGSRWRQTPPSEHQRPGVSLFQGTADGRDPLLWESDELTAVRQLHKRSFDDGPEYMAAPNLAAYLGLAPISDIHLPLPLHIVFIGFQGDGHAKVKLGAAELTEWFSQLDHLLPHVRISLADLSCQDDGHCGGAVRGSIAPVPLPSHVRLNFSCNVVVVRRAEVLEAYSRAVSLFGRPVDPDDGEGGARQVDALKMEPFVDSLLEGLGIGPSGYALVVANPQRPDHHGYGFRAGFSSEEVEMLQEEVEALRSLPLSHWDGEPAPPRGAGAGSGPGLLARWSHRTTKFAVGGAEAEGSEWAKRAQTYLEAEEAHRRKLLKAIGPHRRGALAVARAVALLRERSKSETAQLLAATLTLPPEHFHNPKWLAGHPLQDCLTPAWVSRGRWLLLDLAADRPDWGPALGGDGVVVDGTIPDVSRVFASASDAREAAREARAAVGDGEGELRGELDAKKEARLAAASQARAHAASMERAVRGRRPGGEEDEERAEEEEEREAEIALFQAELDVYEEFALTHCNGIVNPPVACADARKAVLELRHELEAATQHSASQVRSFRPHHWDIFGLEEAEDTQPGVTDAEARAREHFLAALSDVLSRGLRHVVAPPAVAWRRGGQLEGAASPYAANVHFTVHVIADNSRVLGDFRARGVHFDVARYQEQVLRLALPRQKFTFSVSELNLLDDPPLAAAFSSSLRTSFVHVPNAARFWAAPDGRAGHGGAAFEEALWIDSPELAARLRRRFQPAPGAARRRGADPHASLEVPVFVFNLDRDAPVLIDEHYNARALDDMVVIFENAANQDEHPTGFMCGGALLPRPLSPMRHALAATLQYLGGALPPHLGYHPQSRLVTHDWLWSVGAHPLSWTSTGTAYSQLHIDSLHRSLVLDAIDASAAAVTAGVALLADEAPGPAAHARLQEVAPTVRDALSLYSQLVGLWRSAVLHASELRHGQAAELIPAIELAGKAFLEACRKIDAHLHPRRCAERRAPLLGPALQRGVLIGSGAAVVVMALALFGAPRRKPRKRE